MTIDYWLNERTYLSKWSPLSTTALRCARRAHSRVTFDWSLLALGPVESVSFASASVALRVLLRRLLIRLPNSTTEVGPGAVPAAAVTARKRNLGRIPGKVLAKSGCS